MATLKMGKLKTEEIKLVTVPKAYHGQAEKSPSA